MPCSYFVGDVGDVLEIVMSGCAGITNLGSAVSQKLLIGFPDGSTVQKDGSLTANPADGKIQYTSVSGDLSFVGTHTLQGWVHFNDGTKRYSDITTFEVGQPISEIS